MAGVAPAASATANAVQNAMESIAQGQEPKEELVFNPVCVIIHHTSDTAHE